jgi:hypothetical protein
VISSPVYRKGDEILDVKCIPRLWELETELVRTPAGPSLPPDSGFAANPVSYYDILVTSLLKRQGLP